jgi:hypothetical protein
VGGFIPEQTMESDCVSPAIVGVDRIVVGALDSLYQAGAGPGCFLRDGGAFLIRRGYGDGEILALGGLTPLTNEFLDQEDDVVLAWNLLGSGEKVVFGTPRPAGAPTPRGLWGLLPDPVRVVILQLGVAAAVFAIARGRRFGRPIEESVPSPIPATELVMATGELYRRARATGHAATLLRDRFRARAGRRLGLGPRPDPDALSRAVSEATGRAEPSWPGAEETRDEGALVAAARELERTERRLEGGEAWEMPARR